MTPRWTVVLLAAVVGLLLVGRAPAGAKAEAAWKKTGTLAKADPEDKIVKGSPHQVHVRPLEAGTIYRIDLASDTYDVLLRLETPAGEPVSLDDDSGGGERGANARIVVRPAKAGNYRLIVTSSDGKAGDYTLTVREGTAAELLMHRAQHLMEVPPADRKALVGEIRTALAAKGAKVGAADAQLAITLAQQLEFTDPGNPKLAAEAYTEFGKLLAGSAIGDVEKLGTMLQGAGRRLSLPGNPMVVRGKSMDGDPVDLTKLQGKVVLVDFWATWCGPCREELPNVLRMYEKYHRKGFEVVGVSIDEDKEMLTKFLAKERLPWPTIHDPSAGAGESLADRYGIFAIPQAILVGRDGKVVTLHARGPQLERLLDELIGGKAKAGTK